MIRAVWQALVGGPSRAAPGRLLLAMLAIATGVALGFSVRLINASADAEFRRAALQLTGEADLVIRGPRQGFDEQLYPRIARLQGVAVASPVVELQASRVGSEGSLRIVGIDALRAARLQPLLHAGGTTPAAELFDANAIRLSAAAARAYGVGTGDRIEFLSGNRSVALRVAGILPDGAYRQVLGIMDIAAAQWRFDRLGRLNRIDIRLAPDADAAAVQAALQGMLPPGTLVLTPDADHARSAGLTRAHRINLDMLALIALFTGAFVVYSTQVLAILQRRNPIALLRALGVPRRTVLGLLLAEGALIGLVGAVAGLAAGWLLARHLLAASGIDPGYFPLLQSGLHLDPLTTLMFLLLGALFSLLGTLAPAIDIVKTPPAQALHAGDPEEWMRRPVPLKPGLAALACGIALLWVPPLYGIPVAGYAAIALLLAGAMLLLPPLAIRALRTASLRLPLPHALGLARLLASPRQVATSMSAILISFSLVVAMMLMIHSFRSSLDVWLGQMLPADLYLRAAAGGDTADLPPEVQHRIAQLPGVRRVEFLRSQQLLLAADRPPVTLLARDPGNGGFAQTLPLVTAALPPPPGAPPAVWISELVADVFDLRPGDTLSLPIGEPPQPWTVAGIWRDYARQNGALVIDRADYIRLTGDRRANDAALWLDSGDTASTVADAVRDAMGPEASPEIATAGDIRRLSLGIFDRTFAVAWALQIAALGIGLLGVALSFGAQALARRREFGMLRHLGMTRREIGVLLAAEGAFSGAIGALFGLLTGSAIGLILIRIINRQSFHWSMELSVPWLLLPAALAGVVFCAAVAARAGAAFGLRRDMVRAVHEDW